MTRFDDLKAMIAHETDECVLWPFATTTGYAALSIDGRMVLGHRWVCQSTHGEPPPAMDAAHSCGVRSCVNPRHLRWASRTDNALDRIAHGTNGRKLTVERVVAIRAKCATGVSQRSVAREFGISQQMVGVIVLNHCWPQERCITAA